MGVQWDPSETRSEKGDVQVQYKPEFDRVVNVGYRFRRDNIEQVDGSVAWPIGKQWSAYARMVYSLRGPDTSLDQFAGFEYRSCCWRIRARRAPLREQPRPATSTPASCCSLNLTACPVSEWARMLSWNDRFGDTPPARPHPRNSR